MIQLFRPKYAVDEIIESLREVFTSGWTGPGPKCREFEKKWLEFVGSNDGCHFVNSCTGALHVAIRLLDLPQGSPIFTTPLTAVPTNAAIMYERMKPIFVDVDDTLSISYEDLVAKWGEINPTDAAIMWVHYGGNVSESFEKLLDNPLTDNIIEDCAHAAGARYADGNRVGSKYTACFSHHPVKNMPTFDSGILVLDKAKEARARALAWFGITSDTYARASNNEYKWKYDVPEIGWKYNGNDVAAAVALVQLKYLDEGNRRRKEIYKRYADIFSGTSVQLIPHNEGSAHHLVVVAVPNRDEVMAIMRKNEISPGMHYILNYKFNDLKPYDFGRCPNAEFYESRIISLPNHLLLTDSEIDRVGEVVVKATRS